MNLFKSTQKTLFTVAFMALAVVGFSACSDDDDKPSNQKIETEMGLFGTYKGDFEVIAPTTKAEGEGETEGEDETTPAPATKLSMVVTFKHQMAMEAYPIDELIAGLYETKEEADAVVKELGNVYAEFAFNSKDINQENGTITLDIDSKDLKLTLKNDDIIELDFDTKDNAGKFTNKGEEGIAIAFDVNATAKLYKAPEKPEEPETPEAETRESEAAPSKVSSANHSFNFLKATK